MFLNKNKTIIIDAFTHDQRIFDDHRPLHARDNIPLWWKNLESSYPDHGYPSIKYPTIKRCMGVIDLFRHGFLFTNNQDRSFESNHAENKLMVDVKLNWILKTKSDVSFITVQPAWHYQDLNRMVSLIPQIYKFKNPTEIDISLIITKKEEGDDELPIIKEKLSIVHFIPFSEQSIEIKYHLIDKKEYDAMLK
jgi:hypothetical protein